MADEAPSKIPWYSYLILIGHLIISATLVLLTHGSALSLGVRWAITGPFFALVLGFGFYDHLAKIDESKIDAKPVDRWTIPHTLAGVVFAAWYVPIVYVLMLVFLWECFEFSVKGFGDKEVVLNRVVDMGVAVGGWLITVAIIMGATHAGFPLATPVA